ncbi:hypothetical protein ACFHWD_03500 [Clostridium sp. MT-14]|uniref:hypothetical protein n=1 Tax=Clostridium sp. MT-14 TaxID=3348360 RepID=UPI0035F46696
MKYDTNKLYQDYLASLGIMPINNVEELKEKYGYMFNIIEYDKLKWYQKIFYKIIGDVDIKLIKRLF